MPYIENPKLAGSGLIACVPQEGSCPFGCPDCFANAANSYLPGHGANIPSREQAEGRIVRVNDANDSNNQRELVMATAADYEDAFYNTSRPRLDFDRPVVLTINPGDKTDASFWTLEDCGLSAPPANLMFVRFRVHTWSMDLCDKAVRYWTGLGTPFVLVFMAHPQEPVRKETRLGTECESRGESLGYIRRKRTLNEYWAVAPDTWASIMYAYRKSPLVYSCGESITGSIKCARCGNCLREYFATKERIKNAT